VRERAHAIDPFGSGNLGTSEGGIMEVKLIVVEGKHKNHEIPLPETIFLIGRDRQCHLRPHCELVSKLHCAIAAWAGKVRLRDLKSRNGTFLNGQPVHGEVTVEDGDRMQIGDLVFAFSIKNEKDAPLPTPLLESDVRWLLEAPSDSGVLCAANQTWDLPIPTGLPPTEDQPEGSEPASLDASGEEKPGGSKAVSAGQHLRDYFEKRKRRKRKQAEARAEGLRAPDIRLG
jgi:pSer/pThr/pTyr-binding forkhead associated (FHA) protein